MDLRDIGGTSGVWFTCRHDAGTETLVTTRKLDPPAAVAWFTEAALAVLTARHDAYHDIDDTEVKCELCVAEESLPEVLAAYAATFGSATGSDQIQVAIDGACTVSLVPATEAEIVDAEFGAIMAANYDESEDLNSNSQ